jgi:cyclophilin family peptidyl-prolyl cis-trans isomerase
MNLWGKWGCSLWRPLSLAVLVSALVSAGCGKKEGPTTGTGSQPGTDAQANSQDKQTPAVPPPVVSLPGGGDRLHQSFAEATRNGDNPPINENRPPDETMTKKLTFKILQEVQQKWDGIRFTTKSGKPIHYSATMETNFGSIEIELKPESAPNHVRNFIALARAGYYDELLFDRIKHEVSPGQDELKLDLIEGGCPVGSGDPASGSIGYWLKPEFNVNEKHEPGAIGACHGFESDSAATRFYIILSKNASYLDGNFTVFARVKSGLDVVRKIAEQPVVVDETEQNNPSRRPEKPIVIKKVIIHSDAGTGAES